MKKLLLTLAAVATLTAQAQQFEVVSNQQLSVGATDVFHPQFTPDGNSLLVSSASYDGLGVIDIAMVKLLLCIVKTTKHKVLRFIALT